MHKIVLFGIQGSGKTTQGAYFAKRLRIRHLNTGDLIRREMALQTPFGQRVTATMNAGDLVSDEDVEDLLFRTLKQARSSGWILDGYPRRRSQADNLLHLDRPTNLIELMIPEDLSIHRLSHRRSCPKGHIYHLHDDPPRMLDVCDHDRLPLYQRLDDQSSAIRQRQTLYNEETVPAIQWLRLNGIVHSVIDASQPISRIRNDIEWQLHFR